MNFRFSTGNSARLRGSVEIWANPEVMAFRSLIQKKNFPIIIDTGCPAVEVITQGTIRGLVDATEYLAGLDFVKLAGRKLRPNLSEFDLLTVAAEDGSRLAWFFTMTDRELPLLAVSLTAMAYDAFDACIGDQKIIIWAQMLPPESGQ